MARLTVLALSTALPAFLLVKVLAPAFYSRQDTRTPVKAGVVAVAANILATVLFLAALLWLTGIGREAWAAAGGDFRAALKLLPGAHACLALATAVAGWTNALQLWWYLRRAQVFRAQPGWGRFWRQLAVASVAMAAVVLALLLAWDGWTAWHWSERVWKLAVVVGAGGLVYLAALWLQGTRPRDLRHCACVPGSGQVDRARRARRAPAILCGSHEQAVSRRRWRAAVPQRQCGLHRRVRRPPSRPSRTGAP